jgi:hypothetical protein
VSSAQSAATALQNGSWAPGGAGAFDVWFSDPGGEVAHVVQWALEYVAPLNQWINDLTGDKAKVGEFARTWHGVASDLDGFEDELLASANRISELEGRLARALRKRHDEIRDVLTQASEWSTATADAVELAYSIVQSVHDAVVGALSQLSGLIVTVLVPSLDPFDKINKLRQLANRARGFIEIIGELIEHMIDAFERLVALLQSLMPLIEEGLLYLRETLGVLLKGISPAFGLVPGLLGGAASDLLAGDPRVTELDPGDLTGKQYDAWVEANAVTEINSLTDLINGNGLVDLMGKEDRSVVDIMEVVGPDNKTHWVVALPSTQDWGLIKKLFGSDFADTLKDYPATNDLDSNIALMLMQNPHLATQYQRAVMQAMSDAGVPPGGDVVYTGFSQGGIMAATLASAENSPYHVVGVVTNGSPIGGFDIPSTIPVVSFEHFGDPVPLLDGEPIDTKALFSPNRHVVVLPTPGLNFDPNNTHNNENYANSVAAWEHSDGPSQLDLPDFYSGTVVSNQQHTWGE